MHFAKEIKHSFLFNFNLISTTGTSKGFNEMILKASNSQNYQRDSTIKDSFYMYAILYMRGREKNLCTNGGTHLEGLSGGGQV